ncbi:MAG: DUF6088 family protein [Acutalibacteraceae bacterium]|nr:DUF6088 family protein [Acutalibacteraceae bacterium]
MTLYETLLNCFGYNEPFKTSEINFEDYSKEKICIEMTKLCKKGKVVRFETGIYYIPKTNKFGTVIFNQSKIVDKKYIKDGEQVFGYYSGTELEYRLGLTKVKPNTIVIYTNGETTRMRRVMVGSQRIILRKPRTKIDKFNASILCFLELMNGIEIETLDEYKRKLISDYITENRITQRQITKYIPYFPDKTCRNLIESEVIYRVPQ